MKRLKLKDLKIVEKKMKIRKKEIIIKENNNNSKNINNLFDFKIKNICFLLVKVLLCRDI